MASCSLEWDIGKVVQSKTSVLGRAQAALDVQVIKDSNYFCPEDEGTLQASALTASRIGQGHVEWNTPYAREQYYSKPNKSQDRNPHARMKWFEVAKAQWLKHWLRLTQGALDG